MSSILTGAFEGCSGHLRAVGCACFICQSVPRGVAQAVSTTELHGLDHASPDDDSLLHESFSTGSYLDVYVFVYITSV